MLAVRPVLVLKDLNKEKPKRKENKKRNIYKIKLVEQEAKEEMRDFWKESQKNAEYTLYEIIT
jgi:hypothetical protein